MPLRVANSVERNVISVPTIPILIAAGQTMDVLKDITGNNAEYSARYIQNVGNGDCYYAIGHDCDKTNFNGILAKAGSVDANGYGSGMQFDASNTGQKVAVYSVSGTTIAVTILRRNDNSAGQGNIL